MKMTLLAVNIIGVNFVNAVLEKANKVSALVIVQFRNRTSRFSVGVSLDENDQTTAIASAAASHLHTVAFRDLNCINRNA